MPIEQFDQKVEGDGEDYPSDYFECLQSVFSVSDVAGKFLNHYAEFTKTGNRKELLTAFMLSARNYLDNLFGFKELTLTEIRSLLSISRGLLSQISWEPEKTEKRSRFNPGLEVVTNWLNENYGILMSDEEKISVSLLEEAKERGEKEKDLDKQWDERKKQFANYVRKVRDKALNQR